MAGVEQAAETDPESVQQFQAAVAMLRDDAARNFRVDVETNSTIAADDDEEKQRRTEFLSMVGAFFQQAGPIVAAMPEAAPLMGEMLTFGARGFKAGRELESELEQFVATLKERAAQAQQQPQGQAAPPPDPAAQAKAMATVEVAKATVAEKQANIQAKGAELQIKQQQAAVDAQDKAQRLEIGRAHV